MNPLKLQNLLGVLALMNAAAGANADTLALHNGDQLTGEILYLEDGLLIFRADMAGEIPVKWKHVKTVTTSAPVRIVLKNTADKDRQSRLQSSVDGQVQLDDGSVVVVTDIARLARTRDNSVGWQFDGNFDVSFDLHRERNVSSDKVDTKLDTRVVELDWRHTIKADYQLERKAREDTARNYSLDYSIDYFFANPWYWRVRTQRERDYFNNGQRDVAYATGPGYQFKDDEQGRFGVDIEYIRFRFARDYDEEATLTVSPLRFHAVGLGWDFNRRWHATGFELFANGNLYVPDIAEIRYALLSEQGIRYHLTRRVNLSLRLEFDQIALPSFTEIDKRHELGIGVDW